MASTMPYLTKIVLRKIKVIDYKDFSYILQREVIFMRKYKKRKKFSTIIINKSQICSVAARFLLIAAIVFLSFTFTTSSVSPKMIIQMCIPHLKNNADSSLAFFKDILSSELLLQKVLAETIPILSTPPDKETQKEQPDKTNEKIFEVLPPPIPENTYPIKNSSIVSKNLEVRNETTYQPDFNSLLYAPLDFKSPEILIVHTHASESYKQDNLNYYTESETDRTTDTNRNVVKVGTHLAEELTKYGFKVTHAKDINDHPSYNKSYTKTLGVINSHLEANSNIQIVIDLHRDAIIKNDGSKLKFTSVINGETVSQVMIVCGTNQAGLDNDTWQENLKFAMKLQNYMENTYPGFARPLNLRQERFNTHATKGSMIIEVGTSGNTLSEAVGAVKYLAKTISEVLKPYM